MLDDASQKLDFTHWSLVVQAEEKEHCPSTPEEAVPQTPIMLTSSEAITPLEQLSATAESPVPEAGVQAAAQVRETVPSVAVLLRQS